MRSEKLFKSTSFVTSSLLQLKLQFSSNSAPIVLLFRKEERCARTQVDLNPVLHGYSLLAVVSNADSACNNFLKLAVHGRGNYMLTAGSVYTHENF